MDGTSVYYISYKGSSLIEGVHDLWQALVLLFSVFYTFNVLFPKSCVRTLEFIQRSVFKVCNKQIRVSRQISNKFINELYEFIINVSNVIEEEGGYT